MGVAAPAGDEDVVQPGRVGLEDLGRRAVVQAAEVQRFLDRDGQPGDVPPGAGEEGLRRA
ncbi:hypothetical protein V5D56_19900 [Cellulosimicrobium sp. PMB13]|uniref:hypothetical protein n=1 Tax=Cellulosimicrobium sp. PMB13 TaxID=3120158 RepID=UPI003F4C0E1A